jgi:hypothetical protein
MFALYSNQIDALQCFAAGLLSVTEIAKRLDDDAINIVDYTTDLDAEPLFLLQADESEPLHIPTVGAGSKSVLMHVNRIAPAGDDYEELIIVIRPADGE